MPSLASFRDRTHIQDLALVEWFFTGQHLSQ